MALTDVAVLLVDDDPVFRQLVTDYLISQQATVFQAASGHQGLELFEKKQIDVVVADLSMPGLGGLNMLKQLIEMDPSIPAIVISGHSVMADVVEALRIGASDYLIKPIPDLFIIGQAIEQAIEDAVNQSANANLQSSEESALQTMLESEMGPLNQLSYQELNDNLHLLEQSALAAKSVQQQLFPASNVDYPLAEINYSLFKNDDISAYFIDSTMVGDKHLICYMAHFHPEDNSAAFGCVLLRSFVNQKLKLYRNGLSTTLIEPFNMLSYLNERMVKSGLHMQVDVSYICIELTQYRVAIGQAGNGLRCYLRNHMGLAPIALPESKPLGSEHWQKPSTQFRSLMPGESLCIATQDQQHQAMLLDDEFVGLVFRENIASGGFMELKAK
ncbi:response regulator receiver protein [Shewanella denitrificans OS217]|jgi:CheY-like chemotaxis protein|uniref:Response regulator receiver protein n=1 Tax=Shewanella denitrificans (strain OS217 / ATCC BAA-1090 / DSM 15013) TaxID=318161 RepID=Q12PI4_SHEDO|nr:response regulator [Shewanella denitrificans]ABE54642.1 response regulator receiver protein [Shewanella denitrificans OS217]